MQPDEQPIEARAQVLEARLVEHLLVHLVREDGRPHPVAVRAREAHLLEEELGLLALVHAPERLYGDLLQDLGGLGDLALRLADAGERARKSRTLNFDVDLRRMAVCTWGRGVLCQNP